MNRNLVLMARIVVGLTWLYEGLWLKIMRPDATQLRIVAQIFQGLHLAPIDMLRGLGGIETMLAFGVLAGWNPRVLAVVQAVLLVCMDAAGMILANSRFPDPIGTLLRDLTLLICILLIGLNERTTFASSSPPSTPTKSRSRKQ